MITVHKTVIEELGPGADNSVLIQLPAYSEILTVAEQYDKVVVWYRCDDGLGLVPHRLYICPTGEPVPKEARYISTVLLYSGALVFHFFDGGQVL